MVGECDIKDMLVCSQSIVLYHFLICLPMVGQRPITIDPVIESSTEAQNKSEVGCVTRTQQACEARPGLASHASVLLLLQVRLLSLF